MKLTTRIPSVSRNITLLFSVFYTHCGHLHLFYNMTSAFKTLTFLPCTCDLFTFIHVPHSIRIKLLSKPVVQHTTLHCIPSTKQGSFMENQQGIKCPTMHYFGIPRHNQSLKAYYFYDIQLLILRFPNRNRVKLNCGNVVTFLY